jgi:hypothetical protein
MHPNQPMPRGRMARPVRRGALGGAYARQTTKTNWRGFASGRPYAGGSPAAARPPQHNSNMQSDKTTVNKKTRQARGGAATSSQALKHDINMSPVPIARLNISTARSSKSTRDEVCLALRARTGSRWE